MGKVYPFPQSKRRKRLSRRDGRFVMQTAFLMLVAGFAAFHGLGRLADIPGKMPHLATSGYDGAVASSTCHIKGNISFNTGARIYHLPGQDYYDATVINPAKGERWFCSEQEAIAAGWRRSKR